MSNSLPQTCQNFSLSSLVFQARYIVEDLVHLLETPTLRLGDEEPDPREAEYAEDGEEDVGPETVGVLDQGRYDQSNYEVVQPIGACRQCNTIGPGRGWEDLTRHGWTMLSVCDASMAGLRVGAGEVSISGQRLTPGYRSPTGTEREHV